MRTLSRLAAHDTRARTSRKAFASYPDLVVEHADRAGLAAGCDDVGFVLRALRVDARPAEQVRTAQKLTSLSTAGGRIDLGNLVEKERCDMDELKDQ